MFSAGLWDQATVSSDYLGTSAAHSLPVSRMLAIGKLLFACSSDAFSVTSLESQKLM